MKASEAAEARLIKCNRRDWSWVGATSLKKAKRGRPLLIVPENRNRQAALRLEFEINRQS